MAPRTHENSSYLSGKIRKRRIGLELSVEEAAAKAGIGAKTWARYEAGESIRSDKVRGVCKALGWNSLPVETPEAMAVEEEDQAWFEELKTTHTAWSSYIADRYGQKAAASFAIGSDILKDHINEDLDELGTMPRGTHAGQLSCSWIVDDLPPQFRMRYDYDFYYSFLMAVLGLRRDAHYGKRIVVHTVLDELALHLMLECSTDLVESWEPEHPEEEDAYWNEWAGNICGDNDLSSALYSDILVTPGSEYHFDNWQKPQFNMDPQPDENPRGVPAPHGAS